MGSVYPIFIYGEEIYKITRDIKRNLKALWGHIYRIYPHMWEHFKTHPYVLCSVKRIEDKTNCVLFRLYIVGTVGRRRIICKTITIGDTTME